MTLNEFKASLNNPKPPVVADQNLTALWFDATGNWDKAHDIVQETSGTNGDWIHAYLHRKEGDLSNASYWYARAGKKRPNISLEEEWEKIAVFLLTN